MRTGKYILEGHEPKLIEDVLKWGEWYETADRCVALTNIGIPKWKFWLSKVFKVKKWLPVRISTVFLGLDYSFGEGSPLLFETMVFGGKLDQEMNRYSTWDEAEKGHQEMVEKVQNSIKK